MIKLENEQVIWESENGNLLLNTHRLRQLEKSIFGSTIKSIMLEDLSSSELNSFRQVHFLKKLFLTFLFLNGVVYVLNQYLFKSELLKFFFG